MFKDLSLASFSVFLDNVIQTLACDGGHSLLVSVTLLCLWRPGCSIPSAHWKVHLQHCESNIYQREAIISTLFQPTHLLISCLGTSFSWPLLPSCWSSGLETAQPVVPSPFWSVYLCDWIEVMDFLLQKKKSMAIPTNIYSKFQGFFRFPYLSKLYSSLR